MKKIFLPEEAISYANAMHEQKKKIVLVGGCFDILHRGHLAFLEKAKAAGDILIVLLEHDAHIKKMKGPNRPLNTQQDRAYLLSHLTLVDAVTLLPGLVDNTFYDNLVLQLKPAIIATTAGDSSRVHKERQAKQIGAEVIDVTPAIQNQSTTQLFSVLNEI
jgi:FAD synthetase